MLTEVLVWVGGVALFVLGLWSLASVPKVIAEARRDYRSAARTTGRVVDLVEEPATGPDAGAPTWHPVVKFEALDGQEYTFHARYGTTPAKWKVGDSIKVAYPPGKPGLAEVDTPFMAYQPVFIALLVGVVFLAFGVTLLSFALASG